LVEFVSPNPEYLESSKELEVGLNPLAVCSGLVSVRLVVLEDSGFLLQGGGEDRCPDYILWFWPSALDPTSQPILVRLYRI